MAAGTVLSTVVLGWLTDDLVLPEFNGTEGDRTRTTVIAAVLAVAAMRSLGVVVRRYFAAKTVYRCKNDFQKALGYHYLAMPADELRVAPKGRLLAHMDSDVDVATEMLSPLPFAIGVLALLGGSVLSLALLDWVLMLVALGLIPLITGLNRINIAVAKGPAADVRVAVGRVSGVASESFDGALVVKTLGRERAELERFSTHADALRNDSVRLGRVRALFGAALDLLPDIGVVVLVALGAWCVANGHITAGQLVQAVALFSILVFPLRVIGYFFESFPPGVVAYDRVALVLAGAVAPERGSRGVRSGPLAVHASGLTVRYNDFLALDDVAFEADPGEVVALVGRTGCGKSTLLMALSDMVPLDAGKVLISGEAVGDISRAAMAARTAIVWQHPFLLDGSVHDNIVFGGSFDPVDIHQAARDARFDDVIAGLANGYESHVGESGVRLSGGQRQRLVLARALVRRPGLLLLDDALSAVDPLIEEEILDAIRSVGSTMVIVAHRRSTILMADRIVMMDRGRIRAVGPHRDLLSVPAYVALLEAYDREGVTR